MTLHVVQFSGGIGSWACAQRVLARYGTSDLVLLIADTKAEDPDLWRFAREASAQIGVDLTIVADGRTPFRSSKTNASWETPAWPHAPQSSNNAPAGPG